MDENKKSKIGGISANKLVIPLVILLFFLYVSLGILTYEVYRTTNEISDKMQKSGFYQQEISSMQAGAGLMSETSTNFVVMPLTEEGSVNVGPLKAYAGELENDRRGPQVVERFEKYEVSEKAMDYLKAASEFSEKLREIQSHVISLMKSVYHFPPIPELENIPDVPLTPEEQAMTNEQRVELARKLILGSDYGTTKSYFTENATNCGQTLQEDFNEASTKGEQHIANLRKGLWVVILLVLIITVVVFILFYMWLIMPLRSYAKLITSDSELKKRGRVREIRLVATSYNGLLTRRNKLENILRSAAETDSLTGLPNRYGLEQNLVEIGENGGSMAVVLFDVNYLKRVNDTEDHLAGDRLIKTTGDCILECFGTENKDNCYRIGGDEFLALMRDCNEDEIKTKIDHFKLATERENISVSAGYSYTAEADENSFKNLMAEADKRMYAQKKIIHGIE